MLNEDKLRLMTGIALYEKKTEKTIRPAVSFFAADYVGGHLLRAFLAYTFCFLVCVLLWGLCRLEVLIDTVSLELLRTLVRKFFVCYIAGLAAYVMVTAAVFHLRYAAAKRELKIYTAKLKRLEKRYEFQGRTRENAKEGGPL